ncbi:hypothetical protein [Escherichia coli]|uniref:hypothetical protein n=1 Tax=Escherichia coli TaxID=562 RepID=UPI00203D42CA|nr:hypothetical protein [Escherichia coli]
MNKTKGCLIANFATVPFEDNAIVPGYIKYESAAQKEAKGLWADTNPVPPWQWRQANEKPRKVKEKK